MDIMPGRNAIHPSWLKHLNSEFDKDYFRGIAGAISKSELAGARVFPPRNEFFASLALTQPESIKVVILGQDPYHGFGQAEGLAFSVPDGVKIPPSLKNILKEIERDTGVRPSCNGSLKYLATQGVLLLNSSLSVEESKAGSHAKSGWQVFTKRVIEVVNELDSRVVFLLWGAHAAECAGNIDASKHFVLKTSHPSPLSSYRGFEGCGHFTRANNFLMSAGRSPINWTG